MFEDRINRWGNKLNLVSEVIEEWLQVQRQWISLQAIFQSPDINKQLPAEGKRFASVNKGAPHTLSAQAHLHSNAATAAAAAVSLPIAIGAVLEIPSLILFLCHYVLFLFSFCVCS